MDSKRKEKQTESQAQARLGKTGQERRDFLRAGFCLAGVCGAAGLAAPFIAQLRPDAGQAAASALDIDVSAVPLGGQITVDWRGRPVIIRNRLPAEVAAARQVRLSDLPDRLARNANLPAAAAADDAARSAGKGRENWLVFINVCTHLGCPTQAAAAGWLCPCHGSRYDTAARVVKGPANRNMAVPPYRFITDTVIRLG